MPRVPISDLRLGMSLRRNPFLLREVSLSATRAGSTMLRVTLADRSGTIPGVQFDVPSHIVESLTPGGGVEVTGRVGEHRDDLQVSIERIVPADLGDLVEFLPAARRPMAEMLAEFDAMRASVRDPDLARLLDALFGDAAFYKAFSEAPAAKIYHHACLGGLLEHTLGVARIVQTACGIYPELQRDLAVTVALLHDLGKVRAYDARSFDLTQEGIIWRHLFIGASQVEQAIAQLPGFDAELRLRVVHAMLASHGKLEYGSPVVPMTLEAIVLHAADMMDGDARGALDHLERSRGDTGSFTRHSAMHDARLFRSLPEN
jgi:3'-5' exoribonuclease